MPGLFLREYRPLYCYAPCGMVRDGVFLCAQNGVFIMFVAELHEVEDLTKEEAIAELTDLASQLSKRVILLLCRIIEDRAAGSVSPKLIQFPRHEAG